jgi:hypothetical protein
MSSLSAARAVAGQLLCAMHVSLVGGYDKGLTSVCVCGRAGLVY